MNAINKNDVSMFEVGDKVVKTHPKNTILWPVLGVYKNGGVWLDYKGFCWKPPRVRHATDEEIKAGHRIDCKKLEGEVMRSEFEKAFKKEYQQADYLAALKFNEVNNGYMPIKEVDPPDVNFWVCVGVNASWWAFQHQQSKVDELQAENKMLHKAAATHLRNQNQFMDLYNRLVEQLYPYAIDLEEPVDGDVNITSQEFINGYNRARECAHYNLLEMMESDEEYIRAQCGMLGGGGAA